MGIAPVPAPRPAAWRAAPSRGKGSRAARLRSHCPRVSASASTIAASSRVRLPPCFATASRHACGKGRSLPTEGSAGGQEGRLLRRFPLLQPPRRPRREAPGCRKSSPSIPRQQGDAALQLPYTAGERLRHRNSDRGGAGDHQQHSANLQYHRRRRRRLPESPGFSRGFPRPPAARAFGTRPSPAAAWPAACAEIPRSRRRASEVTSQPRRCWRRRPPPPPRRRCRSRRRQITCGERWRAPRSAAPFAFG